eukprot:9118064-Alexandrium_andersonii.AAC.1
MQLNRPAKKRPAAQASSQAPKRQKTTKTKASATLWTGSHSITGAVLTVRLRSDRPTSTSNGQLVSLYEAQKQ